MSQVLGVKHTAPSFSVPDACDCHVHVFGPLNLYPQVASRGYTAGPVSVNKLVARNRAVDISRTVIVQASPQGTDNGFLMDSLQRLNALGHPARGVAVVQPNSSDTELAEMHQVGIRGLRVNLFSGGVTDIDVASKALKNATALAFEMRWHVQICASLMTIDSLHEALMKSAVPVVIDHFGLAKASDGISQPGLAGLCRLMAEGQGYVKLSAAHRIAALPDCVGAGDIARALIDANIQRVLWGSDWPHPGVWPGVLYDRSEPRPYHPIDDGAQLNRLGTWTSEAERQSILVDNPAVLYGF